MIRDFYEHTERGFRLFHELVELVLIFAVVLTVKIAVEIYETATDAVEERD